MGKIAGEIGQTKPFGRLEQEVAVTLLRTGDVLRHAIEAALRPRGVSPEQYNVLRILRSARDKGHPTLEIAQRMISRSPNITRMIDKLIAKGLARRERAEDDRRVVRIRITPKGLEVLARADKAAEGVLDKIGCLKDRQMESLVDLLDCVREHLAVRTVREEMAGRTPDQS